MYLSLKKVLLFSALSIFIFGCSKKDYSTFFNDYFPLEVGNTWVYLYTYDIPSERPYYPVDSAIITMEIIKDTLLDNGITAFIMKHTREMNNSVSISHSLRYIKDDVYYKAGHYTQYNQAAILYKKDLAVGDFWESIPDNPNNSVYTKKIVEKEYLGFPYLNQVSKGYLISWGDSVTAMPLYDRTEEVFVPFIGMVQQTVSQTIYGIIHEQKYVLTAYYTK